MDEDNQLGFEFPALGRRKMEANFAGGQVSSDGGVMLLRQVDRWLGFTKQLDRILPDRRNPLLIQHSQQSLLRQRIYGLALGYEDINDHDSLRHDLLLADRHGSGPRVRKLFDALPVGEPSWSKRSMVNPSSVVRTVRGQFFCTTQRTNPGF